MLKKLFFLPCLAIAFFTSCQKDLKNGEVLTNSTDAEENGAAALSLLTGVVDNTSSWYGTYAGYFNPYPLIADEDFIAGGVAKLPYLDRQFSFSNISYDIPAKYNISGDSISFEAKVKNPRSTGFSNFDVVLQLVGEKNSAEVHFVADEEYVQYTKYFVGNKIQSKLPELVHLFGTFQVLKLAQKNYYTAVYINNHLVYKFKYGTKNAIGRLKTANIAFKGYGSCTKAGMKNSYTSSPIFSEDFDVEGQSNTIYY